MGNEGLESGTDSSSGSSMEIDSLEERGLLEMKKKEKGRNERRYIHEVAVGFLYNKRLDPDNLVPPPYFL